MIVPEYWAEAHIKKRVKNRQITVKRFGWSDISELEAQQHAKSRADEAMALLESGKKITRREAKRAYNGAEGVPIREEIICRYDDALITRNSYGALCLNSPDVLFADVDFEDQPNTQVYVWVFVCLMTAAIASSVLLNSWQIFTLLWLAAMILTFFIANLLFTLILSITGGVEKRVKRRIKKFSEKNPHWHLRLYRTPAGYRVLVMHKTFTPTAEETLRFFHDLKSDPIYVRMCQNQRCFRARLSPKPWRIGIEKPIKPRTAVWSIHPDKMPNRIAWVENYEKKARKYAACQFEEKLGSDVVDAKAEYIRVIHDEYCRVNSHLAIA